MTTNTITSRKAFTEACKSIFVTPKFFVGTDGFAQITLTYNGHNRTVHSNRPFDDILQDAKDFKAEIDVAHQGRLAAERAAREQRQKEADARRAENAKQAVLDREALCERVTLYWRGREDDHYTSGFFLAAVHKMRNFEKLRREFSERLTLDPTHALEWGTDIFTAAAEYRTAHGILAAFDKHCIEGTASPAEIRTNLIARLKETVMHRARSTSRSTSACSNLMDEHKLAADAAACDSFYS